MNTVHHKFFQKKYILNLIKNKIFDDKNILNAKFIALHYL